MNKKLYQKRLVEGKLLVKNYKNSMYALGKYIVNTLNEFPELTLKQLATDIKMNKNTVYRLKGYYEKNLNLFGKKENETTFLVLVKAEKAYKVSLSSLTKMDAKRLLKDGLKTTNLVKKLESSVNKVISNYNNLTPEEHLELNKVYQRLQEIIEGRFQVVA